MQRRILAQQRMEERIKELKKIKISQKAQDLLAKEEQEREGEKRRVIELEEKQKRKGERRQHQLSIMKRRQIENEVQEKEAEFQRANRAEQSKVAFDEWQEKNIIKRK